MMTATDSVSEDPIAMVVEDSIPFAHGLIELLELDGISALHAKTKAEAVSLLQDDTTAIDLVFLDIRMPDGLGLDLIHDIHLRDPDLPVLVVTAYDTEEYRLKARTKGIFEFIKKGSSAADNCRSWARHALLYREIAKRARDIEESQLSLLRAGSEDDGATFFELGAESVPRLVIESFRVFGSRTSGASIVFSDSVIDYDMLSRCYPIFNKIARRMTEEEQGETFAKFNRATSMYWKGALTGECWLSDLEFSEFPLGCGDLRIPMFVGDDLMGVVNLSFGQLPFLHWPLRNRIVQYFSTTAERFQQLVRKHSDITSTDRTSAADRYPSIDSCENIVLSTRPDDWSGLYIIGSFDSQITFYDQQIRALNLVRALFETGDVNRGHRVAVVGGGVAGATAGMALAKEGCIVELYEKGDALFPMQMSCRHRFIHPHLYRWPAEGSLSNEAGLPFLDWSADYAHNVISCFLAEIEEFCNMSESLHLNLRSNITRFEKCSVGEPPFRVTLTGNEAEIDEKFHAVVVAAGFGIENSSRTVPRTPSYWHGDDLDGTFGNSRTKRKILVSGSGDGGLIDLARTVVVNFRHDEFLRAVTSDRVFRQFADEMIEIDEEDRRLRTLGKERLNLDQEYDSCGSSSQAVSVFRRHVSFRMDTDVTFNYRSKGVFSLGSALVNRMIAFLILRSDIVRRKYGEVSIDAELSPDNQYVARFNGGDSFETYDTVLLRHGASMQFIPDTFPELASHCGELRGRMRELNIPGKLSHATFNWFKGG